MGSRAVRKRLALVWLWNQRPVRIERLARIERHARCSADAGCTVGHAGHAGHAGLERRRCERAAPRGHVGRRFRAAAAGPYA